MINNHWINHQGLGQWRPRKTQNMHKRPKECRKFLTKTPKYHLPNEIRCSDTPTRQTKTRRNGVWKQNGPGQITKNAQTASVESVDECLSLERLNCTAPSQPSFAYEPRKIATAMRRIIYTHLLDAFRTHTPRFLRKKPKKDENKTESIANSSGTAAHFHARQRRRRLFCVLECAPWPANVR